MLAPSSCSIRIWGKTNSVLHSVLRQIGKTRPGLPNYQSYQLFLLGICLVRQTNTVYSAGEFKLVTCTNTTGNEWSVEIETDIENKNKRKIKGNRKMGKQSGYKSRFVG